MTVGESKIDRLRNDLLLGYEQAKRGESRPLNVQEICENGRNRLAELQEQMGLSDSSTIRESADRTSQN